MVAKQPESLSVIPPLGSDSLKGITMSIMRARDEDREGQPQVEGEIRELVRRGLPRGEATNDPGVNNLSSVIQRVSGISVAEIERLISDLQSLRDHLQSEAQRVQREVLQYAQMSQAASRSTKMMAESLAQLKETADSGRTLRAAAP